MRFPSIRAVRREQAEEWFWRLVFLGVVCRLSVSGLACDKIGAPLGLVSWAKPRRLMGISERSQAPVLFSFFTVSFSFASMVTSTGAPGLRLTSFPFSFTRVFSTRLQRGLADLNLRRFFGNFLPRTWRFANWKRHVPQRQKIAARSSGKELRTGIWDS
jgi:hypothetical protein